MAQLRQQKARLYKDFDLDFGKNAITGAINKKIDVNAVKQSMQNLLMTLPFERPFHPEIGSDLYRQLFEPMNTFAASGIEKSVTNLFENYEPRVEITNVNVMPRYDYNEYRVKVYFNIRGINNPQELELDLERLR